MKKRDTKLNERIDNPLDRISLGILLLNREGNVIFANRYLKELLAIEDNASENIRTIVPNFSNDFSGVREYSINGKLMGRNGKKIWFYTVYAGAKKNYESLYLVSHEELKLNFSAEDSVNSAEQELEDILNYSFDGICISDSKDVLRRMNPAYQKISSAKPLDFINKPVADLIKKVLLTNPRPRKLLKKENALL